MPARKLYLDESTGRFVAGVDSSRPVSLDRFFDNDVLELELYFLRPAAAGAPAYYESVSRTADSIIFAVGAPPPSTGTAYALQPTWTNLSATVTATIARTITGSTSANEQQLITFAPEALDGAFTLTIPARTITLASAVSAGIFTTSGSHGLATLQPFTPSAGTPSGFSNGSTLYVANILTPASFYAATTPTTSGVTTWSSSTGGSIATLTASTVALPARVKGADIEAALEGLASVGADNVTVLAVPGQSYRLTFENEKSQVALPLTTIASSLTSIGGKSATVNFATTEMANAISASATLPAVLEVEADNGSLTETLCQVPVTLRNDIAGTASLLPTPGNTFRRMTAPDGSVWQETIDNNGVTSWAKL